MSHTMSDQFHEWLDQCPCEWFREEISENSATYCFVEEEISCPECNEEDK